MDIFEGLDAWRKERMLDQVRYNHLDLVGYLTEEIAEGIQNKTEHESVDWRVDAIVFLINSLEQDEYNAEQCIQEGIREISSRTGSWIPSKGKWCKNMSTEAKAKWVVADYLKCKR